MLAATFAVVLSPLAEPPVANRVGLAPEENFAPLNTDHSFGAPVDDVNIFTGLRQIDSWTAGWCQRASPARRVAYTAGSRGARASLSHST